VRDVIVDGNKWPFIPGTLVVQVTAATDFAYLKDVQNLISGTVVYGSDFSIDETSIKTRTLNAPTVTGGSTNVIVSTQQPDARPVTTTDLDTPGRCGTWDIACHLGLSPGAAAGTGLLTGALLVLGAIIVLRKL
jgi:hypothetical protein